jgi:hypothetical protein
MATERTVLHPFGGVIYLDTADETYQHPFGGVVNSDITAAPAGGDINPSLMLTGVGLSYYGTALILPFLTNKPPGI